MPSRAPFVPVKPEFPEKYPRETSTGVVAILCEGDVNGYEADLLEKWGAKTKPNGRAVHVWPCGTGHSLLGTADAIGRTVSFVVLEDRDFREQAEVAAECKRMRDDRAARSLSILDWRCWRRNEIENYFLDDDVLHPVMTNAFKCTSAVVTKAVDKAVRLLVPFQALQVAFHKTRADWEATDPQRLLQAVDNVLPSHKPAWGPKGLTGVTAKQLEHDLPARLVKWRSLVCDKGGIREPWKGGAFLSTYRGLVQKWSGYSSASPEWREVWAGKEVLKLVRQQLCARKAGWWSTDPSKPQAVAWSAMKNNRERDAHDRRVERTLLPRLVDRLLELITSTSTGARWSEFDELARILAV